MACLALRELVLLSICCATWVDPWLDYEQPQAPTFHEARMRHLEDSLGVVKVQIKYEGHISSKSMVMPRLNLVRRQ
ncbi:hypothetical protein EJ02DRAFT_451012 [Clathrospora elynae]|uniref:Uncharacterized protein n=1 Tax=Clathrospora elynae TaxID=706981 RepID=A0A6A5T1M1_9PLEO|nr:hypothetical protein EJ02DRAFT_451012 [Clathrospora elynae]